MNTTSLARTTPTQQQPARTPTHRPHAAPQRRTDDRSHPAQVEALLDLRRRLLADAWLFDAATAYAAGVEDALAGAAEITGSEALRDALQVPVSAASRSRELPPAGGWFG